MSMPTTSLAHLSLLSLAPPELVAVAAQAGYDHVGLRLLPSSPTGPAYRLMDDPVALRETLARQQDTGVTAFDIEIIRILPEFDAAALRPFFEVGQQLGARAMLVSGEDADLARCAESFARLCEAARPYGLSADLEFMPWTAVRNLREAAALIDAAGQPANAGLLIDALHYARSDSHAEQVAALPRELLHYAQVCDAPAEIPSTVEGMIHCARAERLLPGEGGIALGPLLAALPRDLPISVEIPNVQRVAQLGPLAWAQAARQASVAAWRQAQGLATR
jgi:sugar phosphate isomerase/epimerase